MMTIGYVQHGVKEFLPHIQMRKPEETKYHNGKNATLNTRNLFLHLFPIGVDMLKDQLLPICVLANQEPSQTGRIKNPTKCLNIPRSKNMI